MLEILTTTSYSLLGSGFVDKAAIYNTEGNSRWAGSPGFSVRSFHITIPPYKEKGEKSLISYGDILDPAAAAVPSKTCA